MSFALDVKNILLEELSSISHQPELFCRHPDKDFTRNRKLSFENLMLLYLGMEADTSKMELIRYFSYDPETVPSASAFIQQRSKLLPDVFPLLFQRFNAHFKPSLLNGKYQLLACDGSAFSFMRDPAQEDCYFPPDGKTTNGYNQVHVIALFDVLSQRFCDAVIQPARKRDEYLAMAQIEQRFPDSDSIPIFVADRGFASYNVFAHAIERGFCFLIRINDDRFQRLLDSDYPHEDSFDIQIHRILTRSSSRKKRLHPDQNELYRVINKNTRFDFIEPRSGKEYPISLRVIRFKLSEDNYENLVTNLPVEDFSKQDIDEIMKLYRQRWDIETSFRELKYIFGAGRFHSKKIEFITMELWARFILYNFCSIITTHVVIEKKGPKHSHQVNYTIAYKVCRHFLRIHPGEDPPNIEGLIEQNTLPVRPNRNYPRHKRFRVPVSFTYRI